FLADVVPLRFPSNQASRQPRLPFEGAIVQTIDPAHLADNSNKDDERRLMYVAITRAERYLFVTASGGRRSTFFSAVQDLVKRGGGTVKQSGPQVPSGFELKPTAVRREIRLITSFSDLRYFL